MGTLQCLMRVFYAYRQTFRLLQWAIDLEVEGAPLGRKAAAAVGVAVADGGAARRGRGHLANRVSAAPGLRLFAKRFKD